MAELKTSAGYVPTGDQPRAVEEISRSVMAGERYQTLLGATGTGKTFAIAALAARYVADVLRVWRAERSDRRGEHA